MRFAFDSTHKFFDFLEEHKQHLDINAASTTTDRGGDRWAGNHTFASWKRALTTSAGAGELYEEVGRILEIQEDLMADVPLKNVQTRQRKPAYTGGRVNTKKMLTGQYSQARRRWAPAERPAPPTHATIFINTDYSCAISKEVIAYNTAAPLAMANYLETEHGVMCEIWSLAVCHGVHHTINEPWKDMPGQDILEILVRIKSAQEQLVLEDVAATVSAAWFRRLHFRLFETVGEPTGHYGYPGRSEEKAELALAFAAENELRGHVVTPIGGHHGNLDSKPAAEKWLTKQFRLLEIIE